MGTIPKEVASKDEGIGPRKKNIAQTPCIMYQAWIAHKYIKKSVSCITDGLGMNRKSLYSAGSPGSSCSDGTEITVDSLAFIHLLTLWIILYMVLLWIPKAELTTESESPLAKL